MSTRHAPIAVFAYRRPEHTARMLASLRGNAEHESSPIYVFLDGPGGEQDAQDVALTRATVRRYAPKQAHIIERESNSGLANSIIAGVSQIVGEHGCVIVLEDDLVLSPHALRYFNDALERYRTEDRVMHVAGYAFPLRAALPEASFYREAGCWGWATWARAWAKFQPDGSKLRDEIVSRGMRFEFDVHGSMEYLNMLERQVAGLNDSWAIRWYASVVLARGLALHPAQSLVANRGFDGTGVHSHETRMYDVKLAEQPVRRFPDRIEECEEALAAMIAFRRRHRTLRMRLYHRLSRMCRKAMRLGTSG